MVLFTFVLLLMLLQILNKQTTISFQMNNLCDLFRIVFLIYHFELH